MIVVTAYVGILLIFAIFAFVVHYEPLEKTLTANDVYKQCLDNVIEIKATSKNIGESFGIGEIISADVGCYECACYYIYSLGHYKRI